MAYIIFVSFQIQSVEDQNVQLPSAIAGSLPNTSLSRCRSELMPSPMGALSKGRESVYKSKRKRSIDILNSLFETLYQFSFNHKEGACVTSFEG
jgi:hypothetical protein